MSWQATAYVAELIDNITRSEKLVLLCLANRHNVDQDKAWPSVGRLAREALMSERTVHRTLEALESKGIIAVERRPGSTSGYAFVGFGTPDKMAEVSRPAPREMSPPPLTNRARNVTPPLTKQALTPDIAVSPEQRTEKEPAEPSLQPACLPARPVLHLLYEQHFGLITPFIIDGLNDLQELFPELWIPEAFELAKTKGARAPIPFVKAVLQRWARDGRPAEPVEDNSARAQLLRRARQGVAR